MPWVAQAVRSEGMNPLFLESTGFLMAEVASEGVGEGDGQFSSNIPLSRAVVGCGQIRGPKEARELASLYVVPSFRGRGIGSDLVRALVERERQHCFTEARDMRLTLVCLSVTQAFYKRLGFTRVEDLSSLPLLQRVEVVLGNVYARFFVDNAEVISMELISKV
eukprot:CAMPEP_0184689072 /NCGR_PEP_ID=MMETSP0312-20130426/30452_1 /TAXON_ID=31354 /ORGANISM="Compsopogon coeruleus, Strain SAG 36.94" /LENGTH=163 /DNA_ID=CAMNT_0027146379 /DNA_START=524 /DNA_END=1015 /DNA_ORIENTATION=+